MEKDKEEDDNTYVLLILLLLGLVGISMNYGASDEEKKPKIDIEIKPKEVQTASDYIDIPPEGPQKLDQIPGINQSPINIPLLGTGAVPYVNQIPGINQTPINVPLLNSIPNNILAGVDVNQIPIINRGILDSPSLNYNLFSYFRALTFIVVIPTTVLNLLRYMGNELGGAVNDFRDRMNDRIIEGLIIPQRGPPNPIYNPDAPDFRFMGIGRSDGNNVIMGNEIPNKNIAGLFLTRHRRERENLEEPEQNLVIEDNVEINNRIENIIEENVQIVEVIDLDAIRKKLEEMLNTKEDFNEKLVEDIKKVLNQLIENIDEQRERNLLLQILNKLQAGKSDIPLIKDLLKIFIKSNIKDIAVNLKKKLGMRMHLKDLLSKMLNDKKIMKENTTRFRTEALNFISIYYPRAVNMELFKKLKSAEQSGSNYRSKVHVNLSKGFTSWLQDLRDLLKILKEPEW
jgi:hypothetical protein